MLFGDIIKNTSEFGYYNFNKCDYLPRIPSIVVGGASYPQDLRSIVLIHGWNEWTFEEMETINEYGRRFTDIHDAQSNTRFNSNYLHIGKYIGYYDYGSYAKYGGYSDFGQVVYRVKRQSWGSIKYFTRYDEFIHYIDYLLSCSYYGV